MAKSRVVIVGAGIVGLANALAAASRGNQVTVFERTPYACGASIRNFGMVWPIGQPSGAYHEIALKSRSLWTQVADEAGVWLNPCGSIHLAHHDDEWEVLQQFESLASGLGFECELLSPARIEELTPAANPTGLKGGLFSPTEMAVNPRTASARIAAWLQHRWKVDFHFSTSVSSIDDRNVILSNGHTQAYDQVVICTGADFESLFPQAYADTDLVKCKLQMLQTLPQPTSWKIGTHIASGLTLRHYRCFEVCPALTKVKHRIANDTPELDRYGIHVMASQNDLGEVILGDSHEYGSDITPFDSNYIDELMIRELRKIIRLPEWSIRQRWHGVYLKSPSGPCFVSPTPIPNVHIFNGLGGSGMTMSFGLADRAWDHWHHQRPYATTSKGDHVAST